MKKPFASPMALLLAVLLLILQYAGNSPALHGFLHGEQAGAHTCHEHPMPEGDDSEDQESCDGTCAVVLLAGGVTLTPELVLGAVEPVAGVLNPEGAHAIILQGPARTFDARAPPVL